MDVPRRVAIRVVEEATGCPVSDNFIIIFRRKSSPLAQYYGTMHFLFRKSHQAIPVYFLSSHILLIDLAVSELTQIKGNKEIWAW